MTGPELNVQQIMDVDEQMGNVKRKHARLVESDDEFDTLPTFEQDQEQIVKTEDLTRIAEDDMNFAERIKIYYQRLFPFNEFFLWLSYGNVEKYMFSNREFSFTLEKEVYIRYKSFQSADQLKDEIVRLCPHKIDIGAIYNLKPKDKKSVVEGAFVPVERELIFDIDMTDYDDIRTCCDGANICLKCWDFMTISIKIIHRALTEDFGFKNILWVYSGRRGVHCWVCDPSARKLTTEARRAVVSYLEVIKGGDKQLKKLSLKGTLHPSLTYISLTSKAYMVCSKYFPETLLGKMGVLDKESEWSKILALVPDEEIRNNLHFDWSSAKNSKTSLEKWEQLEREIRYVKKPVLLGTTLRDIIFQYTYPRLDTNVSIGLNHLLKSPFCVHPKTGRVCIPIDPMQCEKFNPMDAPCLKDLISQLDSNQQGPDLMKPHMDLFKVFLKSLSETIRENLREKRVKEEKKLAF